jgi:hypothetical protein
MIVTFFLKLGTFFIINADKLSSIINNCVSTKSLSSFENLLLFSYRAFNVAEKSDKSLNKHIKENLSNFEEPQIRTGSKKRTNLSLAKKVEAKVADFDIRGAVKLLSSDDSFHHLANFFSQTLSNQETLV